MANNNGGKITFGVGFNVDTSGLKQVKQALNAIYTAGTKSIINAKSADQARDKLTAVEETADKVERALMKAFNPKLDSLNVTRFNQELSNYDLTIEKIYSDFSQVGAVGQRAFASVAAQIYGANLNLKSTQNILDKMGETLANTIKWNISSSIINQFSGAVQNAFNYVKALDGSLNDIRIVTGDSQEKMDAFAQSANEAAAALGRQTKDYTNAYLTFAQQGLSPEDRTIRTEATLKASNITGQDPSEMADDLTAVLNGYDVSVNDTEKTVSKLAAVADTSASDMSELATAMSKSASVAKNTGVTIDQLAAQIATITQVTRQAPETTGNALKTIYMRINDIKAGTDDAEISLGNYTKKMADVGISVLDANGRLRETGDVMTEIGQKWSSMTREQQTYLAETMAGQRQANTLLALFDNQATYQKELNTSLEANNELNEKNDIYMESLTAHTNQLKAAQEGLIQSLVDTDSFKNVIDFGTSLLNIFTKLSDAIGGGGVVLANFASTLSLIFNKTIAGQINSIVTNVQNAFNNKAILQQSEQMINQIAGLNGISSNPAVAAMQKSYERIAEYAPALTSEQRNQYNELIKQEGLLVQQKQDYENIIAEAEKYAKQLNGAGSNIRGNSEELVDLQIQIKDITKEIEKAKDAANSVIFKSGGISRDSKKAIKETIQGIDLSSLQGNTSLPPEVQQAVQTLDDVNSNKIPVTKSHLQDIQNALIIIYKYANQAGAALDIDIDNINKKLDEQDTAFGKVNAALEGIQKEAEQQSLIQNIVQATAAIGQLSSSGAGLMNIFSGLNDGTVDATGAISGLAAMIPTLISGFVALQAAMGPIGLVLGAISVAIPFVVKEIDSLHTSAKEAGEALKESTDEYSSGLDNLDSLNTQLDETKNKIDEIQSKGTISITDAQDLVNLKAQNAELEAEIKNQETLNKINAEATNKATRQAFKSGTFDMASNDQNFYGTDVDLAKKSAQANGQDISKSSADYLIGIGQFDKKAEEAFVQAVKAANNGEVPKEIQANIDEWEKNYEETLKDESDKMSQAQEALPSALATQDKELIKQLKDVITQYYKNSGQLEDQIANAWSGTGIDIDKIKEIQKAVKELSEDGKELDENSLKDKIGADAFNNLKAISDSTGISIETLTSGLGDLDLSLVKVGEDTDETTDKMQNQADALSTIVAGAKDAKDALESISKGNVLGEDDQTALNTELDALLEKYPQLAQDIKTVREAMNDGVDSVYNYADAMGNIENAIDVAKLDQTREDAEESAQQLQSILDAMTSDDGVTIEINDEALKYFENELDNYINAEHVIDVTVNTKLDEAVEQIQGQFDSIAGAANKIGDNFVVAASDLDALSEAFPGILQGMQELSDGSYQLNEDIVNNAIGAATAETTANAESVAAQIENNIALMEDKEAQYRAIAAAAQAMATNEVTSDSDAAKAKEQISNAVKKIRVDDSQIASNAQMSDQQVVANDSDTKGAAIAANYASAASSASQSVADWANSSIRSANQVGQAMANAAKAMTTGKYTKTNANASGINASNTYKGTTTQKQTASNDIGDLTSSSAIDSYLSKFGNTSEGYQNLANAANAAADAIAKNIAKQRDSLTMLGASANGIAKGLTNIGNGNAYAPSSKSGKSGSGNGGNKGSQKQAKSSADILKDWIKDSDIDRYHKLNRELEDLDDNINHIEKDADKSTRQGLSANLDREIAALEKENGLYQEKEKLLRQDMANAKATAKQMGVQFDGQNNIINYTQLEIEHQQKYNGLLAEAAKTTDATAQEVILNEAAIEKSRWDNLKKAMDGYEKLQDTLQDTEDKVQDIVDKETELKIQQFKIDIDLQIEVSEAKRDFNKFRKEVIDKIKDDDYVGQAKARMQDFFSYYDKTGTGEIQKLSDKVNKIRQEARIIENGGTSSIYGKDEKSALDDLKKYNDELMTNLEDAQEIVEDIHKNYLDTIDKAKEMFDDQVDAYNQVDKLIEHDMNLITLLHGDEDYEDLGNWYDQRAQNYNQEIDFYRKQADMWKQQMDNAKKGTDEWKKFRDNWMSSITDLNSAVENAVQNLLDKYNNTINKIIKNTKDQMLGGDWNKALDQWDRAKWNDNRYLDVASRATGVLDFVDNVNSAMNKQSPRVQKQLSEFMDKEVDDLNNIANLRQIDLDIANKKLEVLQKQIALEDAQNAKTSMRLRRDSQGNYTYQYVADDDQVQSAQNDLRDSLEELRKLAKEDVSDTIDEVQDKLQDFFDKAAELSQTYYDDQEVLQEKLLELQEEYFGEDGYITKLGVDYNTMQSQLIELTGAEFGNLLTEMGDNLKAFLGLNGDEASDDSVWASIQTLIGEDGAIPTLFDAFVNEVYQKNFDNMGQLNQDFLFGSDTGLSPSWNTALGQVGESYMDLTNNVIIPAMNSIIQANQVYQQDLLNLQSVAWVVFTDIANGVDYDIGQTQGLIQTNGALIQTMEDEVSAAEAVYGEIQSLVGAYQEAEAAAIEAAQAANDFWMAVTGANIVSSPHNSSLPSGIINQVPTGTDNSFGSSSGGGSGGASGGGAGAANASASNPKNNYKVVTQFQGYQNAYNSNGSLKGTNRSAKWKYFATGGYTGEWANGSDEGNGRLAFLHQKELVLNKDDTKNMLSAVSIVRNLMSSVSGISSNLLNNLASGISLAKAFKMNKTDNSSVDQNVHIEATFPNVSSSQEIEKALNNLVNAASQRANLNRRKY